MYTYIHFDTKLSSAVVMTKLRAPNKTPALAQEWDVWSMESEWAKKQVVVAHLRVRLYIADSLFHCRYIGSG